MGMSLRIFIVNDDDSLKRLPLAKFERLRRGDPKEHLSEHAGKRMRYALVALEMENRKPIGINLIQYSYLTIDSKGRIDAAERERGARLALEMLPPISSENIDQNIIDAQHRFAKKQYDHQFTWEPSPEIEAAIVKEIFR
jgi:hypothetical protein